jgi:hypothetical protein
MTNTYQTDVWALEQLRGWEAQEQAECVTFLKPNGVGALQIGYAMKPGGESPDKVTCGPFSGLVAKYATGGRFWRKWWLRRTSLLLYITYNCRLEDKGAEAEEADQIIGSLC